MTNHIRLFAHCSTKRDNYVRSQITPFHAESSQRRDVPTASRPNVESSQRPVVSRTSRSRRDVESVTPKSTAPILQNHNVLKHSIPHSFRQVCCLMKNTFGRLRSSGIFTDTWQAKTSRAITFKRAIKPHVRQQFLR